jgi:hypothetical protein
VYWPEFFMAAVPQLRNCGIAEFDMELLIAVMLFSGKTKTLYWLAWGFFARCAARGYAGRLMVEYHKSSPGTSPSRATHCERSTCVHVRRTACSEPVLVFLRRSSNAPVSRRGKGGRRFVVPHHEEPALAPPARPPCRASGPQCSLIGGLCTGPPHTGLFEGPQTAQC